MRLLLQDLLDAFVTQKKEKKKKKKALTYISPFIKYCVGDGQK